MSLSRALKLPYPGYLLLVFRNTVVTWLLVRLFLFAFFVLAVKGDILTAARQPTWGLPAALVWIDRKRCHELLLPANLGVSELWFWAPSLLTSFGLDVLAGFALGSW